MRIIKIINGEECYEEVLQAYDSLFNLAISRHNKILFVRFDIRFNQDYVYPDDNNLLSKFIEALRKHCKEEGLDPFYLWVREKATSHNHHYHVILLLNGNIIKNPYNIFNKAAYLWRICLNNDTPKLVNNGSHIMIRRNAVDFVYACHEVQKYVNYLAKTRSKGCAPKGVREMGMSNLF